MAGLHDFSVWLSSKLIGLKVDDSIFGSYIQGILDTDDTSDEKIDAIQGLLSEMCDEGLDIEAECKEILDRWSRINVVPDSTALDDSVIDSKLALLLESQRLVPTTCRAHTAEELKIKEAILKQYNEMTDEEGEDEEDATVESDSKMQRNTNAQVVAQAERERRDQAKQDSQKKKDKDKEDREKQRQLKEDKKEKRKPQKGERRR